MTPLLLRRHMPGERLGRNGAREGEFGHGPDACEILQGEGAETGFHIRCQRRVRGHERVVDVRIAVIRTGLRRSPVFLVEPLDATRVHCLGTKGQRLAVRVRDRPRHGHVDGNRSRNDPDGTPSLRALQVLADDVREEVAFGPEHLGVPEHGLVVVPVRHRTGVFENADSDIEQEFLRDLPWLVGFRLRHHRRVGHRRAGTSHREAGERQRRHGERFDDPVDYRHGSFDSGGAGSRTCREHRS